MALPYVPEDAAAFAARFPGAPADIAERSYTSQLIGKQVRALLSLRYRRRCRRRRRRGSAVLLLRPPPPQSRYQATAATAPPHAPSPTSSRAW